MKMQLGKWGRSLAVRLPKQLVERFDLKEGDEIDAAVLEQALILSTEERRQAAAAEIERMRWPLPANWKFDREEANAR